MIWTNEMKIYPANNTQWYKITEGDKMAHFFMIKAEQMLVAQVF